MRAYVYGIVGVILGVLGTLGVLQAQTIFYRLDRIEQFLAQLSMAMRG